MSDVKNWNDIFDKKHIKEVYNQKILFRPSVGLDKITPMHFRNNLDENIDVILRKVHNGTYHFTRYKQLLMVKSADKLPRSLCVPTLRDKLTISLVNEYLNAVYGKNICCSTMPQFIIPEIMKALPNYSHFIKLDVSTFFASIDQDLLIQMISKTVKEPNAISLIEKAIKTPAIIYPPKTPVKYYPRTKGIPEGLSVSNSLANIFLSDIDSKYKAKKNIAYWRYVDDILILLNEEDYDAVLNEIKADIAAKHLEFNDKMEEGKLAKKDFSYLGYFISNNSVSVRKSTVLKMEQSLEDLFKKINVKNPDHLQWRLNLKISGFIVNERSYGWMFFFYGITDISLLYHLDDVVEKLIKRYKLGNKIKVKRFVRAYHEIGKNFDKTKYVPDFDKMSIDEKKEILSKIYGKDLSGADEKEIKIMFGTIISKEIKDIEKDIQYIP